MKIPNEMKAVACERPMRASELEWRDSTTPKPKPNQALLKVSAFGLNRADIAQRQGKYPPPPGVSSILGLEASGEVVAVGSEVSPHHLGERWACLVPGGAYAEYVAVNLQSGFQVPPEYSMTSAAALPEALAVCARLFFEIATLAPGMRVLLHGGSSGIHSLSIPLAKHLGCFVATTVRTEEKALYVRTLGADQVIRYVEQDFSEALSKEQPFDLIVDLVGSAYLGRNLSLLKKFGNLAFLNFQGSSDAQIDFKTFFSKAATLTAVLIRSLPEERKAQLMSSAREKILPHLLNGKLPKLEQRVFQASQIRDAHTWMEESHHCGKIVVQLDF